MCVCVICSECSFVHAACVRARTFVSDMRRVLVCACLLRVCVLVRSLVICGECSFEHGICVCVHAHALASLQQILELE